MWTRIFLAILALAVLFVGFFYFYSYSWLQSPGNPVNTIAGYEYNAGVAWLCLIISSVILLIIGNAVIWSTERSWALWATFLFFSIFVIVQYFWLGETAFHFKKEKGLFDGSFSLGPFFAVGLIVAAGVAVFVDHFAMIRLYRKIYSPSGSTSEQQSDTDPVSIEVEERS